MVIKKSQALLCLKTIRLILPLLTTQLVSGRINLIGQYLFGAKYNLTCEEVDGARPGSFHLRFISCNCFFMSLRVGLESRNVSLIETLRHCERSNFSSFYGSIESSPHVMKELEVKF